MHTPVQTAEETAVKIIRFVRGGEVVTLRNVPPTRTLLEVLREDLACTGTKEGCGEGDCGACTVVLGEVEEGALHLRAINSCIRLAHSVDGLALWTVEDLPAADGQLHPAQQAMLQCHASQCGFCTPGFVMSLFAVYHTHVQKGKPVTRALAQEVLSGNLCRCTGYRPILQAAQQMAISPTARLDEAQLMQLLAAIRPEPASERAQNSAGLGATRSGYIAPLTLDALLTARAAHPDAQLIAGATDVGLWITKQHRQFDKVLDLTKVPALRRIEHFPQHITIGAAVTLADAFDALVEDRPQLRVFATRFAGLPVRNSGTLGGNVANGSPIGDAMPLLIALGASITLMRVRGQRALPLEQLYTGYRTNVMAADELLAWITIPKPEAGENFQIYKISKRFDDDISAVCLAINLQIQDGVVARASLGAGGVAATPVRAAKTEAALLGQPWTQRTVQHAMDTLRSEFSPISDMRASAAYRVQVLGNLLQRYWLESQGVQQINLQSFHLEQGT